MSFDLNTFGAIQAHASALPPRRKPPKHRHATPSGPWPFLDLDEKIDPESLSSPPPQPNFDQEPEIGINHAGSDSRSYWSHYPESQFANWTQWQQNKSGIAKLVNRRVPLADHCRIFKIHIDSNGIFHADNLGSEEGDYIVKSGVVGSRDVSESIDNFWQVLGEKPPPESRVRVLFVDNLSGPVLQMLGTRFRIEPFFFSSSLNSIPSRYQEQVRPGKGDHITLTLSFIRTLPNSSTMPHSLASSFVDSLANEDASHMLQSSFLMQIPMIDVEAPLMLTSNPSKLLVLDLLSLHVIRKKFIPESTEPQPTDESNYGHGSAPPPFTREQSNISSNSESSSSSSISTIISYHNPSMPPYKTTTASNLHMRLMAAGRSVYWSNIFSPTVPSGDPTFVTLSLLWYPLYAWDEVLDALLGEVAFLEAHTLSSLPSESQDQDQDAHDQTHILTHQLHVVRAHLLHYESLLDDFRKTVEFVQNTHHPGLAQPSPPIPFPRTQSPIRTKPATASQYPDSLRSALPDQSGEAPTLSAAAKDTLDQVLEEEEYENVESQRRFAAPRMSTGPTESESYERLLDKECNNLLSEIGRLEMTRAMLNKRLGNVMELAFSSINIEDSRRMKNLAEVSVRDSAGKSDICALSHTLPMVFLPASFMATVFGMNVVEINSGSKETLGHYAAAAIPLTVVTVWVMMMQYRSTKQHRQSRLTPSSNVFTFARVAPASVWTRTIGKDLSPWGKGTGRARNRNRSRSQATRMAVSGSVHPPSRPMSTAPVENGHAEPSPVARLPRGSTVSV
ncbi:hypothetical protein BT96DRAFT_918423 [Gymnopus androsaceus JB14]|uniref:Cora-domain-containing protein n=1 Tax=Gymnopus androsaceus JB14 TaxID=1447944 RepID=A0A6A4HSU4_9AGAR|nr:hypothetical protein BT96DRAFT_918423 [Gymnopus androsaceus JB14]